MCLELLLASCDTGGGPLAAPVPGEESAKAIAEMPRSLEVVRRNWHQFYSPCWMYVSGDLISHRSTNLGGLWMRTSKCPDCKLD